MLEPDRFKTPTLRKIFDEMVSNGLLKNPWPGRNEAIAQMADALIGMLDHVSRYPDPLLQSTVLPFVRLLLTSLSSVLKKELSQTTQMEKNCDPNCHDSNASHDVVFHRS